MIQQQSIWEHSDPDHLKSSKATITVLCIYNVRIVDSL